MAGASCCLDSWRLKKQPPPFNGSENRKLHGRLSQLPVKNAVYDANDCLIFLYSATTANSSNSIAQTAIIPVGNFANSFASYLQIAVQASDPANSTSLTVSGGSVFASNSFLYVAISRDDLKS
jgi:hypothetical protein